MSEKCENCGRDKIQLFSSLACPIKDCAPQTCDAVTGSGKHRCELPPGHPLPHQATGSFTFGKNKVPTLIYWPIGFCLGIQ